MTNECLEQLIWVDSEVATPESPIFGWAEGKIYRVLSELASAQVTAKPTRFYAITLKDLRPWFLNIVLSPCITDILQKSLLFFLERLTRARVW